MVVEALVDDQGARDGVALALLQWAGVNYEFANLVSVDTSECGRGRDIAWVLSQP